MTFSFRLLVGVARVLVVVGSALFYAQAAVEITSITDVTVEQAGAFDDLNRLEEGDNVTLRCDARYLGPGSLLIWQRGTTILTTNERITVETRPTVARGDSSPRGAYSHYLTISPIVGADRGIYRCRIYEPSSGNVTIDTWEVPLTVFSFPTASPRCGGPATVVYTGDVVLLNCTSSNGYPTVNVTLSAPSTVTSLEEDTTSDTITATSEWIASSTQDGVVNFTCLVTSTRYPNDTRSCVIGPVRVETKPTTTTTKLTVYPIDVIKTSPISPGDQGSVGPVSTEEASPPTGSPMTSPCLQWLITFIVTVVVLVVSLITNVVLAARMYMLSSRNSDVAARAYQAKIEEARNGNNYFANGGVDNKVFTVEPNGIDISTSRL